ncbi:unnamed protein product, partial [Strongylus vulgaris]
AAQPSTAQFRAAIRTSRSAEHHARTHAATQRKETRPYAAMNSLYTTENVETRVSFAQLVRYSESRAHGRPPSIDTLLVFGLSLPPLINELSESELSQRGDRDDEAPAVIAGIRATLLAACGGVVGVVAAEVLGAPYDGKSLEVDVGAES